MFGVGVGLNDKTYKKLVEMTGSEGRTINAENFDDLRKSGLVLELGTKLCHDPCMT